MVENDDFSWKTVLVLPRFMPSQEDYTGSCFITHSWNPSRIILRSSLLGGGLAPVRWTTAKIGTVPHSDSQMDSSISRCPMFLSVGVFPVKLPRMRSR